MNLELQASLSQARVISAEGRRLTVLLDAEEKDALLALGYPYDAAPGDIVLVISQEEQCFVIGIIEGAGLSRLSVPGDLEFKARGRLKLSAKEGIELSSEHVKVRAGKLELLADSLVEKCRNAWRWVREALSLKAGSVQTTSEGEYLVKAGRIDERAKNDVRIDGRKINLG